METPNMKLRKFDLENEKGAYMNVESYFNDNWDKIDDKMKELEEGALLEFESNGANIKSYPEGAKGLFSPRIEGVKPYANLAVSGTNNENWSASSKATVEANKITFKEADTTNAVVELPVSLKANTTYTLIYKVVSVSNYAPTKWGLYLPTQTIFTNSVIGSNISTASTLSVGQVVKKAFSTASNVSDKKLVLSLNNDSGTGCTLSISDIAILEGDQTSNPDAIYRPPFTIPSQSYDLVSRGKNLFDGHLEYGKVDFATGKKVDSILDLRSANRIKVPGGATILLCGELRGRIGIFEYDANNNFIRYSTSRQAPTILNEQTDNLMFFGALTTFSNSLQSNIIITISATSSQTYIPHTSSTATFTVPEEYPLVELPNGVKNMSGENYEINVKKIKLDGSRKWKIDSATKTDTITFSMTTQLDEVPANPQGTIAVISDMFHSATNIYQLDIEGIQLFTSPNRIAISVKKSKLVTQDVTGFKNWLQENNVTAYYQIATPLTIKDGEQGYKAPTSIQAYENGDLVVTGVKKKTLDENVSFEYLDTRAGGKRVYTGIEGFKDYMHNTLSFGYDDFTVTKLNGNLLMNKLTTQETNTVEWRKEYGFVLNLPDSDTDWTETPTDKQINDYFREHPLRLQYTISPSSYINPKIRGQVPSNMSTAVTNVVKGLDATNSKCMTLEQKLDMLIVLNS